MPTTTTALTIEDILAVTPLATDNVHGGATDAELAAALGVTKAEVNAVLMSAWRKDDYRVNAHGDQDPSLTTRQFNRAPMRHFRA